MDIELEKNFKITYPPDHCPECGLQKSSYFGDLLRCINCGYIYCPKHPKASLQKEFVLVGGFPGHEHIHPASILTCNECSPEKRSNMDCEVSP
jgi:hypothetical protein